MGTQAIELQHINIKLLLKDSQDLDLDPVIPVFHSWIQQQYFDELLLDVADYRHVQGGPGVLLIGHEADYSLDNTNNRLGVRYNRKATLAGTNQDRLAQAALAALAAAQRIQEDTRVNGSLRFNGSDIEIFINDRLLAPNTDASRAALNGELQAFSHRLFGGSGYSLTFGGDSRRLLAVSMKAARAFSVGELIANLKSASRAESPAKLGPGSAVSAAWRERLEAAQGAD